MPMVEHRFYKKYYQNPSNVRASYVNANYNAAHLGGSRSRYLYASLKSGYINCNLMNALKNTDHSIYLAISQNIPDAHNTLEQYQVINPSIEGSFLHNTKYLPQLEDPESLLNICRIFF